MGINSQSQALMDKIRAKKGIPLFLNTVARVREANIRQYCTDPPLVEIGKTQDVFVPCPWGMLRIKLYYPKEFMQQDCALLPVVVFYHGGGWTVDTVETHDKAVHVMCASSGCVFASVDYRLAPENRFPAGIEDAYTGLQWIYDNAEKIGVDREKIAVCGDSSGGNFAAVVCQMARDRGGVPIRNQVLIYPNTDFVMAGWKSAETVGSGYYCTKDALLWYWNHYVGDSYDLENPYLCPMRAKSIAYQLLGWFGKKRVILASIIIVAILTYGGVSLFVVMFAVGPILYTMFQEADLPRHLIAAVLFAGSCTFTMTCLPGSPQLTNIIPSQYLGTPLTAAPVFGCIAAVALFLMDYAYCEYCARKARKNGEHWSFQKNFDASKYQTGDRSTLPGAFQAFLPMVVLILFIFIGGKFISNSAMLSVSAMLLGTLSCYLLNLKRFMNMDIRKILASLNNGITSIGSLAAVCGFGAVVQGSAAYGRIVENVTSWQMSPYMLAVVATAVLAAVAGSSSGGARLMLSSMSEYFLSTGADMQIMHRLISIAAGSLDSMPHATGIFLFNDYLGTTHKEIYWHCFWTALVPPAIIALVGATIFTVIA